VVFVALCNCEIAQNSADSQQSAKESPTDAQSQDSPQAAPASTSDQSSQNSQQQDMPSNQANDTQTSVQSEATQQSDPASNKADDAQENASSDQKSQSDTSVSQNSQPAGTSSNQASNAQAQTNVQSDQNIQKLVQEGNAAMKLEAQSRVKQLLVKKSTSNDAGVAKCLGQYKMNVGAGVKCEMKHPKQISCKDYNKQLTLTPFPGAMPNVVADSAEECASRASCCALVAEAYNSVTEFCGCQAPAPPPLENDKLITLGTQ